MAIGLDVDLALAIPPKTAASLKKAFAMHTVADLLAHYPRRYANRGEMTAIEELPVDEYVTVVAEVLTSTSRPMRQRTGTIQEVTITDGRASLTLTFFSQPWRERELRPGVQGMFSGKVNRYRGGAQLTHPDYVLFDDRPMDEVERARWAETPIPVYPATSVLPSPLIAQTIASVLDRLAPVADVLPAEVRMQRGLMSRESALRLVHRPTTDDDWRRAQDALRFEEAFVLQTALLGARTARELSDASARPPKRGGLLDEFDARLPFTLTDDQRELGELLSVELASPHPMNRLIQGEVGSGKTLVALRAMLQVVDAGGQAAMLAPTEVLASQHLRSITTLLGPQLSARLNPVLLTGGLTQGERRRTMLSIVSGQAGLVVGTHALISGRTDFYDLGLVVIDEQHRFGVEQREALAVKAVHPPHTLVLTATPIPRTVAMTVFGDLDVSTIRQLPAGRAGIDSHVIPLAEKPLWLNNVWKRTRAELDLGRQAFVVCAAIDQEEAAALPDDEEPVPELADAPARRVETVLGVLEKLRSLPDFEGKRLEVLHGRMSSDEKDETMRAFADGAIDVLVATTVIEVGVDVPNASVMVVLDADRFGVSQLHQLRGRIGRGTARGIAFFVTPAVAGTAARARVEAVAQTLDGFELAQADLELRREGDVLGRDQSGTRSSLRLLRVVQDARLIDDARTLAERVVQSDPTLARHPDLAAELDRRLEEQQVAFLHRG